MNAMIDFIHRRWMIPVVISALLLTTMAFTTASAASACGSTYTVQSGDTLSGIAFNCGIPLSTVEQYNPQITDPNTIYTGEVISLGAGVVLPNTGGAVSNFTNTSTTANLPKTDIWQKGDSLNSVAQDFGITRSDLKQANPQITDWKSVTVGELINLPADAYTNTGTYSVQSGDTLASIAALYNIPAKTLKQVNPQISDWSTIFVGEQIIIPANLVAVSGTYTVQSGDSLASIADANNVSAAALEEANPQITNWSSIYAGEVINMPTGATPTTYVVQSGDTVGSIANAFGVTHISLKEANPQIHNWNRIYAGELINIP